MYFLWIPCLIFVCVFLAFRRVLIHFLYSFLVGFLWIAWVSYGFRVDFLLVSGRSLVDFVWISCGFLVYFLLVSGGVRVDIMWISCGVRMDSMRISCGILAEFLWISCGFLVDFL